MENEIAETAYKMGWDYRISQDVSTVEEAIKVNLYFKDYTSTGNIQFHFFSLGFEAACDYLDLQKKMGI